MAAAGCVAAAADGRLQVGAALLVVPGGSTGRWRMASGTHYYRKTNLFWLENFCCPGFSNRNARLGQKGVLLSRIWQPGQKATFCPGWCYQPGQRVLPVPRGWCTLLSRLVLPTGTKGPFFSCFHFLNFFLFQLYFCISIKLMYWNSVCMISTNIYIYI